MLIKKLTKNSKIFIQLLIGILLFSLSFPGLFNSEGIPLFAFISLFPVYHSISKMNYREAVFFGFIYGTGNYLLFNYWLAGFDPVAFSIAPTIIGLYHVIFFVMCKYIFNNFKKIAYIPLTLIWLLYEVFKGENIIGYTYGTIAHTMYKTHIITGIADITGTYVISLIIIFPSVFIASILHTGISNFSLKEILLPVFVYILIVITSVLYTMKTTIDYADSKTLRTSFIQHNLDCWLEGNDKLYETALDNLIELSTQAQNYEPELVIWPETAFVPAIEWHKKHKVNKNRLNLVYRMENFLKKYSNSYLIGANETVGLPHEKKFNSVYYYKNGLIVNKYRKNKLVPFTESFPYPRLFPLLYRHTIKLGAKHYQPGESLLNFDINGIIATPLICYEDTFSDVARKGVINGSDLIINFTNDAWSLEPACTMQHLSAAIFRSIENRRTFIRVGTGGFTAVIDPNGKIINHLPILTKGQFTHDVPIYSSNLTFYTKYGNIVEVFLLLVLAVLLFQKIIKSILPVQLLKMKQKLD